MKIASLPSLALAAVLLSSTAVSAQPAPTAAPAAGHWNGDQMRAHMQARRAERLKALHDVLGIQPDQEEAFTAFAAAMHPAGDADGDGRMGDDRASMASMTTPQRLDLMGQRMDQRMARMKANFQRRAEAARALYAVLGPQQKRAMDALPMLRGGGDKGPGMMGRRHWGGHGMGGPGPQDSGQG